MIKKLLILTLVSCSTIAFTFAQDYTSVTTDGITATTTTTTLDTDYERILEAYLKVNFREYAYESLELSKEEIIAMDPIYLAYMQDKNELMTKHIDLLDEYREEMAEDDTRKDERRETADFIENYWENGIAAQELRKDYFDQMEDVIPYEKAFSFFFLEEALEGRIIQNQTLNFMPLVAKIDAPEVIYYRELDRYNMWFKNTPVDVEGKVSLDHQYTYDGLEKLTSSIRSAVSYAAEEDVMTQLDDRCEIIIEKAASMQDDAYADNHADLAKEAFIMIADLLNDVANLDGVVIAPSQITALDTAAKKIDSSILYMDQTTHVYNFFEQAQKTINSIHYKKMMPIDALKMNADTESK